MRDSGLFPLRRLALAAALLVLVGGLGAPAAAVEKPAPLRVMVAGDSISQQFSGDYTWRRRLWEEFQRQGVSAQFVGPRTGTSGPVPFSLGPWQARRHDALAGARLAGQVGRIGGDVATYHPEVVLVMLGFNDLFHGAAPEKVVSNMEAFVDHVWEAQPDARVVLSPVLDTLVHRTGARRAIASRTVNDGYAALVDRLADEGRPITLASQTSWWVPRTQTWDGIHPTPTGETVIAQRYATTLHALGILPKAPALTQGYAPWTTNARAAVKRVRGRVMRFSWTSYRSRLMLTRGLLRIDGKRLRHPLLVRSAVNASSRIRKLRRGHYTVRLAPVRKWLQGSYGPKVRFVVR